MQNFYEHQEVAKNNSTSLILMMCGAIVGTTLITGAVLWCMTFGLGFKYIQHVASVPRIEVRHGELVHHKARKIEFPIGLALFWYATLTTAAGGAIVAVTAGKVKSLKKGGGRRVAQDLGGRLLGDDDEYGGNPYRGDPDCERALNIVEEMAIAARLPVPPVYLLAGQDGINAFAVGDSKDDAVLGLTEGCVRKLSREQLQGVVAHEFAHIFNGDMRTNLQMIGYMHGVLGVTVAARWAILMGSDLLGRCRSRSDITWGVFLMVLGGLLYPIGLIGNLFASLIKAAFSRQREFLADAYAVQFTRNPDGVAGALKRIAGNGNVGSRVRHGRAVECSHLFFADGRRFLRLLSSHPPLTQRILRIEPNWDGRALFDEEEDLGNMNTAFEGTMNFMGGASVAAIQAEEPASDREIFQSEDADAVEYVRSLRESIPDLLLQLTEEPTGTIVELLTLWFASQPDHASDESKHLAPALQANVLALAPVVSNLSPAERLHLLDCAMESVGQIDEASFQAFMGHTGKLDYGTSANDPFRWAWRHLALQIIRKRTNNEIQPSLNALDSVLGPCEVLLSALARAGAEGPMAGFALQRGVTQLGYDLTLREEDDCTAEMLDIALNCLSELSPRRRRDVLLACGAVVSSDQDVSDEEACLIRGICASLGAPIARLLPGQPVAVGA